MAGRGDRRPQPRDPAGATGPAGDPLRGAELARLFELSPDLLATLDSMGRFLSASPSWERALGWDPELLIGTSAVGLIHPDDRLETLGLAGLAGDPDVEIREFENRLRTADGSYRWLQWNVRHSEQRWYAIARDVTARKLLEQHAQHDLLTGLPSRPAITERIGQAVGRLRRRGGIVGLVLIDLDGFTALNSSYGHVAGDSFLRAVAAALLDAVREEDTVARFGGDEFLVLVENCTEAEQVHAVAARALAAVRQPAAIEEEIISGTASAGIAMTAHASSGAEALIREADIAMHRAKSRGGAGWEVFDSDVRAEVEHRVRTERELRASLQAGQLCLHYQPIVSLPDMAVDRYEALVRWEHPERGLLAPEEFIPLAERSGMIVPIGTWVLRTACEQAASWRRAGWDVGVAVNVSARQLERASFVNVVRDALAEHGLPAGSLCLEITETGILHQPEVIAPRLTELSQLGARIAMDDFGSGYSSLSHLERLPLDVIKIDRSFVAGLLRSPEDRAIVSALLSLARETELSVVAEGVESEVLHTQLVALGCRLGQGFFYGSPVPPADVAPDGYSSRIRRGVGDPLVIREFMRQIGIPARIGWT